MIIEDISDHRFFVNFIKYRNLLIELIIRDIKIKYRRSILGIFWSFLEPLLFLIALTIIFSTIFKHDIPNYPVYLLTGRLTFEFFARGTNASMTSIIKNASIIKKVYVPKYMYPLGVTFSNLVTFLLSLIVLLVVMVLTSAPFTLYILLSIIPMILLIIFIVGVGLILATVTVFFRDIEHLYGVFIIVMMYGSAIFYPASIVPAQYQFLLTLNPLYAFITLFRSSFLYGQWFSTSVLLFASASALVSLAVGIILFYKYQDKFILYI